MIGWAVTNAMTFAVMAVSGSGHGILYPSIFFESILS